MKKAITITCTLILFIFTTSGFAIAADVDTKMLKWTANTILAEIGKNKTIVGAVKDQNKMEISLLEIQNIDEAWRHVMEGPYPIVEELMNNECAIEAEFLMSQYPFIIGIVVIDNQGANVCMTFRTADYWQGDEPKFVNAYNGGYGSVFVDEVEEDGGKMVSEVSVPVSEIKEVIGAMTIYVDVDKL